MRGGIRREYSNVDSFALRCVFRLSLCLSLLARLSLFHDGRTATLRLPWYEYHKLNGNVRSTFRYRIFDRTCDQLFKAKSRFTLVIGVANYGITFNEKLS